MQLNICELHRYIFAWHSLTEPITTCWKKQTYENTKIKNHLVKIKSGTYPGMALIIITDCLIVCSRLFYVHVITFVVKKYSIGRNYCFTSMTFWAKQFLYSLVEWSCSLPGVHSAHLQELTIHEDKDRYMYVFRVPCTFQKFNWW